MVLREPGGSSGGQGGGVASHPGAVAGDCGEDCPTYQVWLGKTSSFIQYSYSSYQEDEQQGIGTIAHQYHQVNQERNTTLVTNHYSSDHWINAIE